MESNSMQDLAKAVNSALAVTMATQHVQTRLYDAMLLALTEALPPLTPVIRQHFVALTKTAPAGMDRETTDQYLDAVDYWRSKLRSLES